MFAPIDKTAKSGTGVVEESTSRAAAIPSIAAGNKHSQNVLGGEKLARLLAEFSLLQIVFPILYSLGSVFAFQRIFGNFLKISFIEACKQRLFYRLDVSHFPEQYDFAG